MEMSINNDSIVLEDVLKSCLPREGKKQSEAEIQKKVAQALCNEVQNMMSVFQSIEI